MTEPPATPGPPFPPAWGTPAGADDVQDAIPFGYPKNGVPPFLPNAKSNGMAIAALICGIAGFLLLPACVGMGLGFGALGTIKQTGQPGRGMAVAGIVTSGVWLGLWLVLFVVS